MTDVVLEGRIRDGIRADVHAPARIRLTEEGILKVLMRAKKGTAAGIDQITLWMWKRAAEVQNSKVAMLLARIE